MSKIEKSASIIIRKPLREVFAFVTDPGRFRLWQPFMLETEITSSGPLGKGTTYRYKFQALGRVVDTSGIISEYSPGRRFSFSATASPFPITGGFDFQEDSDGVRLTVFAVAEPAGFASLAGPLIGMVAAREMNNTLQTLKKLIEDRSSN